MKRLLALGISIVFIISMMGCSGQNADTAAQPQQADVNQSTEMPADGSKSDETTPPTSQIKVGIDISSTDVFIQAIQDTMTAACDERGWEHAESVNYQEANKNVQNIQNLITQGCNYIMSYSSDEGAQETVRQMCEDAGVRVVFIGLEIEGYTTVGGGNYDGGQYVAQKLCEKADEKWDGKIDLVIVNEFPEVGEINTKRMGGMVDYVKKAHPELTEEQFVYVDGGLDVLQSTEAAANALTAHPDAERILFLCASDVYQGLGSFNAANAAGRLDQVLISGFHMSDPSTPGMLVQYADTWIGQVDLLGSAYGGKAIEIMDRWEAGENVEGKIEYCDFVWLDASNVADYYEVVY